MYRPDYNESFFMLNSMADTAAACTNSFTRSIPTLNLDENEGLLKTNISNNAENIISQLQISSLEFSVEKIINSTVTREGCRYYQVKWFDSWIDEASLAEKCQHVIDAYWDNRESHTENNPTKETSITENDVCNQLSVLPQGNTEFTDVDRELLMAHEQSINDNEQTDFLNESLANSYSTEEQSDVKKQFKTNTIQEVVIDQSTLLKNSGNVCEVCGKKLSSKKVLRRHVILVHLKNGRHQCTLCHRRFFSSNELSRHMPVHTNVKKFPCKICGKLFKQSGQAYKHWQGHIGEKKFECDKCGSKFLHKNGLLNHYSTHSEERMFECGECKAKFKHKQSVYSHYKRCHSGKRDAICSVCDAGFQNQALLKRHIHEVHASALFSCPKCPRKFMVKKFLEKHIIKHENGKIMPSKCNRQVEQKEDLYKCEICNSSFKTIAAYQGHLIVHKSFQCMICSEAFLSNTSLQDHIKSVHKNDSIGAEGHVPEVVNKIFEDNFSSEDGKGNTHECGECQQAFKSQQNLTSHMHLHQNIPEDQGVLSNQNDKFCIEEDTSSENAANKIQNTVAKSYKCDICSIVFCDNKLLADHRAIHSRKTFVCNVCNKTFKWAYSLARHQEVQHTEADANQSCNKTPTDSPPDGLPKENQFNVQESLPLPLNKSINGSTNTDCQSTHSSKVSTNQKKNWKQYHVDIFRQQTFSCETCQIHYPSQIELMKHLLSTHKSELLRVKKDS